MKLKYNTHSNYERLKAKKRFRQGSVSVMAWLLCILVFASAGEAFYIDSPWGWVQAGMGIGLALFGLWIAPDTRRY